MRRERQRLTFKERGSVVEDGGSRGESERTVGNDVRGLPSLSRDVPDGEHVVGLRGRKEGKVSFDFLPFFAFQRRRKRERHSRSELPIRGSRGEW